MDDSAGNRRTQNRARRRYVLAGLLVLLVAFAMARRPRAHWQSVAGDPDSPVARITTIEEDGGRVDWSHAGDDRIAFDKQGPDGYFDIYTMQPDGSDEQCVTCAQPALPHKHHGQPAWHPSGKWIVFQAEKETHAGSSYQASPGYGTFNDLWLISVDGKDAFQLTTLPNSPDVGVLHPHFSADGHKLTWSQMYRRPHLTTKGEEYGLWSLMVADFDDQATPRLSNVHAYQPAGEAFYENHGLGPDNRTLIFSSTYLRTKPFLHDNDIFDYDLETATLTRLTSDGYNEHALISPDGTRIVWMSSAGNQSGTDFWLMRSDGSDKRRLTSFNQKGHAEYLRGQAIAADSSWNRDGTQIAGYVQSGIVKTTGRIVVLELRP